MSNKAKVIFKNICTALVVVLIILNLFTSFFAVVRYYGDGMEPNISDNQILLILKTDTLSAGDIAAFYYNNKALVRRVVATGGQQVSIDETGLVSVNGSPLDEDYISDKSRGQCNIDFPYNVPLHSYFVMGDSRETSMDSRLKEIGTIPEERIIGKVLFII